MNINNSPLPQYAAVEQPFGCKQQIVHCPICGSSTIKESDSGYEVSPCHHLAFVYIGELGDFEYKSDNFEQRITSSKIVTWLNNLEHWI